MPPLQSWSCQARAYVIQRTGLNTFALTNSLAATAWHRSASAILHHVGIGGYQDARGTALQYFRRRVLSVFLFILPSGVNITAALSRRATERTRAVNQWKDFTAGVICLLAGHLQVYFRCAPAGNLSALVAPVLTSAVSCSAGGFTFFTNCTNGLPVGIMELLLHQLCKGRSIPAITESGYRSTIIRLPRTTGEQRAAQRKGVP